MNRIFRIIRREYKQVWIAVSGKMKSCGSMPLSIVASAAFMAALLCGALPAHALDPAALPTGGQIVAGSGSISQSGSNMTVNQNTNRMVANWNTFNIGQNTAVQFQQPGASSVALNRILDQNPSQIMGSLTANGQIFLLNPSGIIFGQTARVDVGGIVASSLYLSNENFMAGKYLFEKAGTAGAILNQGSIRTANGGYVAFLAPQVQNEGDITANGGSVLMAAADKVTLDFVGDGLLNYSVEQGAVNALAENKGLIKADGGMVVMTAKAADSLTTAVVNNSGIIEAQSLENRNGRIVLDAEGGMTTVSGSLNASSADGLGGRIVATGDRVFLESGSHLTASGATGGGEVLVGGGWQGSDSTIHQATGTIVEQGALLEANATDSGNGGTVVAWSDVTTPLSVTRAYGTFEAKGGPNGGDGGRIETSGHWLDVAGITANASSPKGKGGLWLLDPYNITINAVGPTTAGPSFPTWTAAADSSVILNTAIQDQLDSGTSVTISTGDSGSQGGDITATAPIAKTGGGEATLTLKAARHIDLQSGANISSTTGKLNVQLWADSDNSGDGINIVGCTTIDTKGGFLKFGNNQTATINSVPNILVGGDVFFNGSAAQTISTGGGSVDVYGETIIGNTSGVTINSGGGNIRFYGLLNSGNQYTYIDKTADTTHDWTWARTDAKNGTGGASAVGDSYLVTITSRLENAIAGKAAGYTGAWIGAWRPVETTGAWVWADGPEAGNQFFTQTTNGNGGTTSTGYFSNFGTNEPNGSMTVSPAERVGQFYGSAGGWNDLNMGTPFNEAAAAEQYKVHGYVRETNLAASPLTISAGAGTVTFSGAVGGSKALASLNVTSTNDSGIAINGGAVTTTGLQTYTGNVTLGSASTVLTQTTADTNFTLQESMTNATNADASLTVKTTGAIILNTGSSISSGTGKLNTVLWADSDANANGGAISLTSSSINTNGGHLWMGGGSGSTTWNGLTVGDGSAVNPAAAGNGITLTSSTVSSGVGHIYMNGKSTDATTAHSDGIDINYNNTTSIQSTSGSITLIGTGGTRNTGTTDNSDGLRISGSILSTTGPITLTGYSSGGDQSEAIAVEASSISSTSGNISLNNDVFWMDTANGSVASSGSLTIAPTTVGRTIGIAGTGGLSLAAAYFNTAGKGFVNGFSGITVGSATAGAITVGGATTFNDSTTLLSNSTIAINGAITANENLTLTGNGAITQSAAVAVTGTTAITAGSGNDITLAHTSNNFGGEVSVVSGKNISILDSNAMTLGAVTSTLGTVDIATLTGNLTLTGAVQTTNATASAIKLNAGKNTAAGTSTGGDIIVTGGTVSPGLGGFATLYSGSVAGSTGLTALVGSGTNRFRYNSDEVSGTTNYTTALVAGTNAIYREQPTVITTANAASKTYNGLPYSGGNGVTYAGFANGDTSAVLGGALAYGGTSQGQVNVVGSPFTIVPGGYTNGFGYALTYANGSLTVTPAALSVTADNDGKTYGQTPVLAGTAFTSSGLQNGETIGSATLASGGAAATAGVSGSPYVITADNATGGTFSAGNYTITYNNGALTVTPAALSVTADNDEKNFNGIPYSGGNGVTYSGFVNNETSTILAGILAYGGNSQGAVNTGFYTIKPTGLTASNYTLGFVDGSLTITELNNPVVSNVVASITSFQNHVNGTQDQADSGRGMSNRGAAGMGPGAGSGIFEGNDLGGLISDRTGYLTDEERRKRF